MYEHLTTAVVLVLRPGAVGPAHLARQQRHPLGADVPHVHADRGAEPRQLRRRARDHADDQRAAHARRRRAAAVRLRGRREDARADVPDQLDRAGPHRRRGDDRRGERHRRAGGEVVRGRGAAARRRWRWRPAACAGRRSSRSTCGRATRRSWRRCPALGLAAVLLVGGLLAIDGTVTVGLDRRVQHLRRAPAGAVPDARLHADARPAGGRVGRPHLRDPRHRARDRRPAGRGRPRRAARRGDAPRRHVPLRRGRPGARAPRPPPRRRARASPSSAAPGAASRRSPGCSRASTTRATGPCCVDGHDVRDLTVRSLRAAIGLVLDEPFLFSATVRENIAYGRPDATDEDVRAAARAAGAEAFIDALPEGLRQRGGGARATRCRAGSGSASPSPARCWPTPPS